MKIVLKAGAVLAVMGMGVGLAQAATTNFNADAVVVAPITVTTASPINFGSIASSAAAGTVVVTSGGARSVTGGVTAAGGTPTAASFNVAGAVSTAYTITLPPGATIASGANNMGVAFVAADVTGANLTRATTGAGTDTFSLGGTLTVGASQAAGTYTGVFVMTVNY